MPREAVAQGVCPHAPEQLWGLAVSVDHVLRLTVRFQVGGYHREADVALPAGSALADVIPEIVALVARHGFPGRGRR